VVLHFKGYLGGLLQIFKKKTHKFEMKLNRERKVEILESQR
jgi:hypothetical protein